jgi:hypothetical protein
MMSNRILAVAGFISTLAACAKEPDPMPVGVGNHGASYSVTVAAAILRRCGSARRAL